MIGTARELAKWLSDQPADSLFELKPKRRKRTLTQNAYYWAMLNELARSVGISDKEAHMSMLRDYGTFVDAVYIRADVPEDYYPEYHDIERRVVIDGLYFNEIKIYKGSSKMDGGEFSRLIDGLRHECEQQGIPFMTPSEVALLGWEEGA